MSDDKPRVVQFRVAISEADEVALRVFAVTERRRPSDIIGEAIRAFLDGRELALDAPAAADPSAMRGPDNERT